MKIVHLIKSKLSKRKKALPVDDALSAFNKGTNNTVCSTFACVEALKGHHTEVRENTIIDKDSSIGSYTYVGMNSAITRSTVGNYCSIANNVSIGPGEHDMNDISTSALFYASPVSQLTQKDCVIGNDVWIGVDSIIKRGITIGNGAVIGANSVVTKDIPAYAIAAGSPAKVLRYRFEENMIRKISESAWWDHNLDEAKQIIERLKQEIADVTGL